MSSEIAHPAYRPTGTRRSGPRPTSEFAVLLGQVRGAGLLERTPRFYGGLAAALTAALVFVVGAMVILGHTWVQLVPAALLGVVMAQFGFLGHEAAHREVFESGARNDRVGRIVADLVVGISYSWWRTGHNRHHANPNRITKDPSVATGVFVFAPDPASGSPVAKRIRRAQPFYFFPLLLLAGVDLHLKSFAHVFGRERFEGRRTERILLLVRCSLGVAFPLVVLGPGLGAAFLAVELAAFGLALSSSFVPNHVGMPILPANSDVDYLRRQVVTSRNIRGGRLMTAWMGGLDYQIEHHLFPSMPRPHLEAASHLTKAFCAERGIDYTEVGLGQAFRSIARHLRRAGIADALDPFRCPAARRFGR